MLGAPFVGAKRVIVMNLSAVALGMVMTTSLKGRVSVRILVSHQIKAVGKVAAVHINIE